MYLFRVLIGSLDNLCLLWLAGVITLVLVLRHSFEKRSKPYTSLEHKSAISQTTSSSSFLWGREDKSRNQILLEWRTWILHKFDAFVHKNGNETSRFADGFERLSEVGEIVHFFLSAFEKLVDFLLILPLLFLLSFLSFLVLLSLL